MCTAKFSNTLLQNFAVHIVDIVENFSIFVFKCQKLQSNIIKICRPAKFLAASKLSDVLPTSRDSNRVSYVLSLVYSIRQPIRVRPCWFDYMDDIPVRTNFRPFPTTKKVFYHTIIVQSSCSLYNEHIPAVDCKKKYQKTDSYCHILPK